MNREERRRLKLTKEDGEMYDYYQKLQNTPTDKLIGSGSKVKLNYEQMKNDVNWKLYTGKFKNFVEENKDKELTVLINNNSANKRFNLVSMEEDKNDPKFLFWVGDLIRTEA